MPLSRSIQSYHPRSDGSLVNRYWSLAVVFRCLRVILGMDGSLRRDSYYSSSAVSPPLCRALAHPGSLSGPDPVVRGARGRRCRLYGARSVARTFLARRGGARERDRGHHRYNTPGFGTLHQRRREAVYITTRLATVAQ